MVDPPSNDRLTVSKNAAAESFKQYASSPSICQMCCAVGNWTRLCGWDREGSARSTSTTIYEKLAAQPTIDDSLKIKAAPNAWPISPRTSAYIETTNFSFQMSLFGCFISGDSKIDKIKFPHQLQCQCQHLFVGIPLGTTPIRIDLLYQRQSQTIHWRVQINSPSANI